jgi:hypothetical protein
LSIQPVDSLPNVKSVKISDMLGEAGLSAMEAGRNKVLGSAEIKKASIINSDLTEENYGLFRRAGHWLFKGRFGYGNGGKVSYKDYNINIIPPSKLVFFDDIYIQWTDVKDRVPEAVDAYTSPNGDIALILTKTRLYIYGIEKGKLEKDPLKKIDLKSGETIIMAEWASGRYVENWEKSFLKNQVKEIK